MSRTQRDELSPAILHIRTQYGVESTDNMDNINKCGVWIPAAVGLPAVVSAETWSDGAIKCNDRKCFSLAWPLVKLQAQYRAIARSRSASKKRVWWIIDRYWDVREWWWIQTLVMWYFLHHPGHGTRTSVLQNLCKKENTFYMHVQFNIVIICPWIGKT